MQVSAESRTSRPLRFAMLTTFYPPFSFGGDAQYVRNLAHALARRGHTVEVIHDADAYRQFRGEPEPAAIDPPPGVTVHTLRSALPALSCFATFQLGRPVVHGARIREILSGGFDVIHYHNVSLVGGPRLLSYGRGVKLYTAHEHWLVCPTHVLWRHNRELCTGRECVQCALAHKRPPQIWRAGDLLEREARHIDAFIALSRFSADKHAEFGFAWPMTIMPPFLPNADTSDSSTAAPSGRPYCLFVGRLELIKGLQDVLQVFDASMPADLLIAGTGRDEEALRHLAADRPNVHFLDWCSRERLALLYRSAHAVILPSKCFEVFPLVVLEAFQHGVPIIARRLGPYPEIVANSNAGLLFDDTAEFAAAVRSLVSDGPKRDMLGRAARAAFEAHFSESVAVDSYLDLIRSIAVKRNFDAVASAFDAAMPASRASSPPSERGSQLS